MQERTRALNRHHDARIKVKRTKYVKDWREATMPLKSPTDKQIGRVASTPTNCSCWMCGNPRKFTGELTIEEKSWLEIEKSGSYFPDDSEKKEYYEFN